MWALPGELRLRIVALAHWLWVAHSRVLLEQMPVQTWKTNIGRFYLGSVSRRAMCLELGPVSELIAVWEVRIPQYADFVEGVEERPLRRSRD